MHDKDSVGYVHNLIQLQTDKKDCFSFVAFFDDLFMDHAIDILKGERMVVDVLVLPSVMPDGRDARKLARDMEAVMLEALGRLQRRDF